MIIRLLVILICISVCRAELSEEMTQTFRDYLKNSKFVVLVCIFNESLETNSIPDKHRLYTEATIVRSIRGNCQIGKKIRYYSLLETYPKNVKSDVGLLKFLFIDQLLDEEFPVGTGDVWQYHPALNTLTQDTES